MQAQLVVTMIVIRCVKLIEKKQKLDLSKNKNTLHSLADAVLDKKLEVMDLTAILLCRDHNMPLRVFKMEKAGALLNIVNGGIEGTLIRDE